MTGPSDAAKERLNLDLHPDVKAQLLDLKERIKADSMSEVVRRAIELYGYILTEQEKGSKLMIKPDPGLIREVHFL
jgi:hypothetical protein